MRGDDLIRRRRPNHSRTEPRGAEPVNQVTRPGLAIHDDLRPPVTVLGEVVDDPVHAFAQVAHPLRGAQLTVDRLALALRLAASAGQGDRGAIHREANSRTPAQPRRRLIHRQRVPRLTANRLRRDLRVPDTQTLTPERLWPQLPLHPQDRRLRRPVRETRVRLPPLPPVVRVGVVIRADLHIQAIGQLPRERRLTEATERLARVSRARRRPQAQDERVRGRVHGRNHVV